MHMKIPGLDKPVVWAKDAGLTLIEVLVSLVVLAIGLLGLAMMQTAGLRFTTDSYSRSQSTLSAYDIIEKMRANPSGFAAGNYDAANTAAAQAIITAYAGCKITTTCDCATSQCTSANLALYDLGRWYEQQDRVLTGALTAANQSTAVRATIERTGTAAKITLYWMEQDKLKSQIWQTEIGS
jgi:type IV pilus assembly protein PilV